MNSERLRICTGLLIALLMCSGCAPGQFGNTNFTLPDGEQVRLLGEQLVDFSTTVTTITGDIAHEQEFGIYYRERTYDVNAEPPDDQALRRRRAPGATP